MKLSLDSYVTAPRNTTVESLALCPVVIEIGAESVIIADLFWRDATLVEHQTVL
jgi:hypothetical protein